MLGEFFLLCKLNLMIMKIWRVLKECFPLAKNGNSEHRLMHAQMRSWPVSKHCKPVHKTRLVHKWPLKLHRSHKLTTLLAERVDFLAELACSRHGYMEQVKTRTTAKADKKGLKRRAGV